MSEYFEIEQKSHEVGELFRCASMARAYTSVTEKMGPSQQLIDFINCDGSLGSEIGLEGFESFSTTTQHEILLSKLNPDVADRIAMEGFSDFIKKYRNWLIGAGVVQKLFIGGLLWAPLIAVGAVGIVMKRAENKVSVLKDFKANKASVDSYLSSLKVVIGSLPTNGDKEKWDSFTERLSNLEAKIAEDNDKNISQVMMVSISDSGWTPAELISSATWYNNTVKDVDDIQKKFASELQKLKSDDLETAKAMNKAISQTFSAIKGTHFYLKELKTDLDKVAKCYDVKDKN